MPTATITVKHPKVGGKVHRGKIIVVTGFASADTLAVTGTLTQVLDGDGNPVETSPVANGPGSSAPRRPTRTAVACGGG